FLESQQQGKVTRELAREKEIENRRRDFDERRHEETNTPTLQDRRERSQDHELRRALNDPPRTEICSAPSPHLLPAEVQGRHRLGLVGLAIPVPEAALRQVNVTAGRGGNPGQLKCAENLPWPPALRAPAFDTLRHRIDRSARTAVQRARSGSPPDAGA